jgi:hypothetical protein
MSCLDRSAKETGLRQAINASLSAQRLHSARSLLTNCTYLEDELIEVYGIKIYGSPWYASPCTPLTPFLRQPRNDNWAFNLERGEALLSKWNAIPRGIDILLTHTPPLGIVTIVVGEVDRVAGHGDITRNGTHIGCVELLNTVIKRVRPKYHVFGLLHDGMRWWKVSNMCCSYRLRLHN